VLILKDFKSLFPEVLILIDFKSFAPEVLILIGLWESHKLLILLGLCEKQGKTARRNSNVDAMYTREHSTLLAWRQGARRKLRRKPSYLPVRKPIQAERWTHFGARLGRPAEGYCRCQVLPPSEVEKRRPFSVRIAAEKASRASTSVQSGGWPFS
jgi:hypothetical protein